MSIKTKIFAGVKNSLAEVGLLITTTLALDLERRKIDHVLFCRTHIEGYLRNSQSAIETETGLRIQDLRQAIFA
jgi:hypothetical protein